MLNVVYRCILVSILFAALSCKDAAVTNQKSVNIAFKKEGTLQLKTQNDSLIQTLDIEVADDEYTIQTGLMYRNDMANNQAMLFIFPNEAYRNFYMKNTRIPLDIIFIAADSSIVSIQQNAKPFDETSLPSDAPAKYVLEINAGLSDEWQLRTGDKIDFELNQ